jgi:hypothetical protein
MEYYQPVFARFLSRVSRQAMWRAHFGVPRGLRNRVLFAALTPGQKYVPLDAWRICNDYLTAIEERMRKLLKDHSVFYWLSMIRRTRPGLLTPYDDKTDVMTGHLVRRIQELAIRKFGDLSRTDDVGPAETMPIDDVLGGFFVSTMIEVFGDRSKVEEQYAKMSGQVVMGEFSMNEFLTISRLEGLAYEYWRTSAAMRTIGKGASIERVAGESWIRFVDEPADFDFLITSYDERIGKFNGAATLFGTWQKMEGGYDGSSMLLAYHNVEGLKHDEVVRNAFGVEDKNFVPNFVPWPTSVAAFWKNHKFMAQAFEQTNGLSMESVLFCLWGISSQALVPDRSLAIILNPKTSMSRRMSETASAMHHLLMRGYLNSANDDAAFEADVNNRAQVFKLALPTIPLPLADVKKALKWLSLDAHSQNLMSIWSAGPYLPIIPHANTRVFDTVAVEHVLHSLLFKVRDDVQQKGNVFEIGFRQALADDGFAVERSGVIEAFDGKEREIDASLRFGETLCLFECFASERPLDFDIGKGSTIANRSKSLAEKVDQALTLRDFIVANPKGKNYDFSWATDVKTFVVSPFVEWIWERSADLWVEPNLPRILAADECRQMCQTVRLAVKRTERKARHKKNKVAATPPPRYRKKRK